MKRTSLLISLALAALLALSGCGASESESTTGDTIAPADSFSGTDFAGEEGAETSSDAIKAPAGGSTALGDASYTPGVYKGQGRCYNGTITVSVEVDEGNILSISVENDQEPNGMGKRVFGDLSEVMITENTTEVDGVSGATVTSNGFKEAVNNALFTAVIN